MEEKIKNKGKYAILLILIILLILNIYLVLSIHELKKDVDYIKSDVGEMFYKLLR